MPLTGNMGSESIEGQGEIQKTLEQQSMLIMDLNSMIDMFIKKLNPIMAPRPEKTENDRAITGANETSGYILDIVQINNEKIASLTSTLSYIKSRLDI